MEPVDNRSRRTRLLRGTVAATIATFLALMSHVVAGGAVPGWVGMAVPWTLAVAVCTLLAGRTLSLWRVGAAVAASQVLFHTLFVLGDATPGVAGSTHHHGTLPLPLPLPVSTVAALTPDTTMWLLHAAAAVITVAIVHRGERTARTLLALARSITRSVRARWAVAAGVAAPVPRGATAARAVTEPGIPTHLSHHTAVIARRGPPLLSV